MVILECWDDMYRIRYAVNEFYAADATVVPDGYSPTPEKNEEKGDRNQCKFTFKYSAVQPQGATSLKK